MAGVRRVSVNDAGMRPLVIDCHGGSDRGRMRPSNEDCFVIAELARTLTIHRSNISQAQSTQGQHRAQVLLVADGVGGSEAGEIASGLTCRSIEDFLLNTLQRFSNLQASDEQQALRELQTALCEADSRLFEEAERVPQWRGMGTTLTMAIAVRWRLYVVHAGDSRCYLFSSGNLQQLTQDHTVTAELIRQGIIPPEGAAHSPFRHVVTNIVGGSERGVQAELHSLDLHPDDVILLCSDGLTEMVSDATMLSILQSNPDPKRACECLIEEANRAGGRDNVTAIVGRVQ